MRGDITVNSEVGRGTVFRIDIRAQPVESSDIKPPRPVRRVVALKPGRPRYRILIADDKADNRQLLTKLLKPLEFELREAENGQDALEIWVISDSFLIKSQVVVEVPTFHPAQFFIFSDQVEIFFVFVIKTFKKPGIIFYIGNITDFGNIIVKPPAYRHPVFNFRVLLDGDCL
jgi:hypothetical protein